MDRELVLLEKQKLAGVLGQSLLVLISVQSGQKTPLFCRAPSATIAVCSSLNVKSISFRPAPVKHTKTTEHEQML